MPRVSVILPVYNGERFVESAVRSLLDQTLRDVEIVVVDDGSTDRTPLILREMNDSRLKRLRFERNSGIVAALNHGLARAQGEYIARMDGDDLALPQRLEKQVAFLDEHQEIALLGSQTVVIDEVGETVRRERYPMTADAVRKVIWTHNPFAHSSIVVRRAVLDKLGAYDERFLHNEDYDLWLRILSRHDAANHPEALVLRRVHPGSISSTRHAELVRYRAKTIVHAALHYYRNPLRLLYAVRPAVAYFYWLMRGILQK